MHDLAIVSKIQKIEPIPGKDRIELATIENYHSIVQKGQFHVGDKAIYIFYDSILPERPEFEFLRKRCWSEKWKGFRIRPMKMANMISEGLVMPMDILPEDKPVGTIVTEDLGIRLYDPEAQLEQEVKKKDGPILKYFMKFLWFRTLRRKIHPKDKNSSGYPDIAPKSDETNIELKYDAVKDITEDWYLSEKVEGMASMYHYKRKGNKLNCYSHNLHVYSGAWVEVAKIYDFKNNLKRYCKKHNLKEIAISGEIVGPGIQKNIYHKGSNEFYLYNAYYEGKKRFNMDELKNLAYDLRVALVPQLGVKKIQDFEDVEAILQHCEGNSVIEKGVPREGIVWRTFDGTVSFKAKSRSYKIWFGA